MSSWRKNGQDLAQTSRKWRKKISNGESDGERKIYPSANPDSIILAYRIPLGVLGTLSSDCSLYKTVNHKHNFRSHDAGVCS